MKTYPTKVSLLVLAMISSAMPFVYGDTWLVAPPTTGLFNTGTNWSGSVVPSSAVIDNGGTAVIETGNTFSVTSLLLGSAADTSGNVTQTGGTLTVTGNNVTTGQLFNVGRYGTGSYTASGDSVINATRTSIGGENVAGAGYGTLTLKDNAAFNGSSNEIWVGSKVGATGALVMQGASSLTNAGWIIFGRDGATGSGLLSGTSSLAMTSATGAVGIGIGNNATGTLTLSVDSTLTSANQLRVATHVGSNGTVNLSGNTVTTIAKEVYIGGLSSAGAVGALNMSGAASLNNTANGLDVYFGNVGSSGTLSMIGQSKLLTAGNILFGNGASSVGTATLSDDATLSTSGAGKYIRIGANTGGMGTVTLNNNAAISTDGSQVQVGFGTGAVGELKLNSGTVAVNNSWILIGGAGGSGTLNMSGGEIKKTAGGGGITTATHTDSIAVINHSGGSISNSTITQLTSANGASTTWVANGNAVGSFVDFVLGLNSTADPAFTGTTQFTLAGNADYTVGSLIVNRGSTASLNGGVLTANAITRGVTAGTVAVNFNGTVLRARQDNTAFVSGFGSGDLVVQAGGLAVDTNGFNVTIMSALTGTGVVKKTGAGVLTVSVQNGYTGGTTVEQGTFRLAASNLLADTGALVLKGGTFDAAGFSETLGALSLEENSFITLGSTGTNSLLFADSSSFDWGTSTLSITGSFTNGSTIRFGTDGNALTSAQLALITVNGMAVGFDSSGYLVTTSIPEPSSSVLIMGALALVGCVSVRRRNIRLQNVVG